MSYSDDDDTHELAIGYLLWIFGFLGAHRFYFGRPVSGTIYLFTLGLFLVGWIVDLFLMPRLEASAERRYVAGEKNYTAAWLLLTFTGLFGLHRIYLGKVATGLLYLVTLGLLGIGVIYDFWTLNEQISAINTEQGRYQTA
jgi:TM2 domain-containing membrane protein YozV